MVWAYSRPAGAAKTSGGTEWGQAEFNTYRPLNGRVEMRLTDISFDSGYQFQQMWITFELVMSNGNVVGRAELSKVWGVTPEFKQIGFFYAQTSARLRITGSHNVPSNAGGQWYQFRSDLRWGG